jgi:hypothetical protein
MAPKTDHRDSSTATESRKPKPANRLLRVALVVGLLWYSLLAYLIATSNPATVNIRQIVESDAVVLASVDIDRKVNVDHVWRGDVENGPLDIAFPAGVSVPGDFFIPLRRNATGWEVTPARIGDGVRLVYPASEAIVSQMEKLLGE